MLRLNGITPVMTTCFREDESIDDAALRRQIDFAIEGGAAAVCGPGFAAEFYKLSDAERYHYVEVLVEHTRKRVPAIAATTSGSTRSTIEFSRYAETIGADCLMVAAPRAARHRFSARSAGAGRRRPPASRFARCHVKPVESLCYPASGKPCRCF